MENQRPHPKKTKESRWRFRRLLLPALDKIHNTHAYKSLERRWGRKKLHRLLTFGALLALGALLWACNANRHDKNKHKHHIPVLVSKVRKSDVPLYLDTIGTVTPIDGVTIKTQIDGYLKNVYFKEGQLVKKGDLLAQIDPQPYEAALKQAEGQLMRDEAFLKNARLDLKRYQVLYKEDSVSQQILETQVYLVKQYEGIVKLDQGVVDAARVNLKYCKIVSEITGIIGLRQVNPGNFVQTTDTTPITTVNTISPISVVFPIPEDDLFKVQKNARENDLIAEAYNRQQEIILDKGELAAIDSQIDNTTGTIKLKALFNNEQNHLYPNQFVNIRLKLDTLKNILVIPTAAIQIGREGPYVYVMNDETKSVSSKLVSIKATVAEDTAFTGDLKEGQTVIMQGQDKLTEGTVVSPKVNENPSLPTSGNGSHP